MVASKSATSEKIKVNGRMAVVYEGQRGGKYIKTNGEFVSVKSIKEGGFGKPTSGDVVNKLKPYFPNTIVTKKGKNDIHTFLYGQIVFNRNHDGLKNFLKYVKKCDNINNISYTICYETDNNFVHSPVDVFLGGKDEKNIRVTSKGLDKLLYDSYGIRVAAEGLDELIYDNDGNLIQESRNMQRSYPFGENFSIYIAAVLPREDTQY